MDVPVGGGGLPPDIPAPENGLAVRDEPDRLLLHRQHDDHQGPLAPADQVAVGDHRGPDQLRVQPAELARVDAAGVRAHLRRLLGAVADVQRGSDIARSLAPGLVLARLPADLLRRGIHPRVADPRQGLEGHAARRHAGQGARLHLDIDGLDPGQLVDHPARQHQRLVGLAIQSGRDGRGK